MQQRPNNILNEADAKAKMPDLEKVGNTDRWILKIKASSAAFGFSHSTKVMQLPDGCLVQTSSVENGNTSQALTFVPGARHEDFGSGAG